MTLAEIIARRAALRTEGDGIIAAARAANIDLTEAQDQRMLAITGEMDKLWADMPAAEAASNAAVATTARAEGFAAALEIVALCAVAKAPAKLAHDFLKAGQSLDDARAELVADRADDRVEIINPKRGIQSPEKASSWDKVIAKANARVPAAATSR